jgi:hypothetical protein
MRHIEFLIWLMGWPLTVTITDYISAKEKEITKEAHDETTFGYAWFVIVIWFIVGVLLY